MSKLISIPWIKKIEDTPKEYSLYDDFCFRFADGAVHEKRTRPRGGPIIYIKHLFPPLIYPHYQLLGILRPFYKLLKGIYELSQPYRSKKQKKKDLIQPVYGLGNLLEGIGSVIGGIVWLVILTILSPFIFILSLCFCCFPTILFSLLIYGLSWIIEGFGNIIRGLLQIAFCPLVYFFKFPFRLWLTSPLEEAMPLEDKLDIQTLAIEVRGELQNVLTQEFKKSPKPPRDLEDPEYHRQRFAIKDHNKDVEQQRDKVASALFEINRRHAKGASEGWRTRHTNMEVSAAFLKMFPIPVAQEQYRYRISEENKQAINEFLDLFQPQRGMQAT